MTGQYQQPPMQGQYQQPPMQGQYQQPQMTGQYQQPPMQGQYQQPPMTGQYQQPQMQGQYQQQPMVNQYQQPQIQGQYQQPTLQGQYLMQGQYQQPQMVNQYQQPPMTSQYQQQPMVNQYQHSSSMPKVLESASQMANQYQNVSSMPPANKITANQQFQGTYMNQTIPHVHPVVSQNFTSRYRCDMCKRLGDGTICYSCRQCDMDICQICCNKLLCAPQKNRHQHQLYLTKRQNWRCDLCQQRGQNLSMYCSMCDYDCCIDCYIKGYTQPKNSADSCGVQ